jgi:hypothetical protein
MCSGYWNQIPTQNSRPGTKICRRLETSPVRNSREHEPTETLVMLEFHPRGSQTELVLRHEEFASAETRAIVTVAAGTAV